ncbi:MAG: hypothetical protein MUF64_23770 [Polyangiaceae bacterium]|jgi:hypothetical protein|nr:hypothetical protein [Polyangiaceae bacterium]
MAVSNPPLRALLALAVGVSFAGLIALPDATARASFESPYTLEQTYNTALRYVRIDRSYKVTEKDPNAAYVLFEYRDPAGKDSQGAIELVPTPQAVKVVVQLPKMPRYHEQVLADGLAKKLRDELGEPPKAAPSADAGAPDAKPD